MSYITEKEVFVIEVIELIQKYVEGEYIYITIKKCIKSSGELQLMQGKKLI